MTSTERKHAWRHEWVPLTMRAALSKAKGNRELAQRYLDEARGRRAARGPVEFVSPHPAHQAAAVERAELRGRTDDELAEDLADTLGGDDEAAAERILAELDRRDRAERKRERARERATTKREARDAAREAAYSEALAAGDDPEEAYARIWGLDVEKMRRQDAIDSLRRSGYSGGSFDQLVRAAHRDYVETAWTEAEDACRGYLLSKAGQLAGRPRREGGQGLHVRDLWTANESTARKYASEELRRYWDEHGRMTSADFAASVLGGHMTGATRTGTWA